MSAADLLPRLHDRGFDIRFIAHSKAILKTDFPEALAELDDVLGALSLPVSGFVGGGGGETKMTQDLRRALAARGWAKHRFQIDKNVDGVLRESISHEVDHVRRTAEGNLALEIEWNNKDPFFDRDLENFKRLHQEGAISAGIIVTRGRTLHEGMRGLIERFAERRGIADAEDLRTHRIKSTDRQAEAVAKRFARGAQSFRQIWADVFTSDKYGEATTHWTKLTARIERGVGNPCPLLLIGIPAEVVVED